jgi:hypothetical protein
MLLLSLANYELYWSEIYKTENIEILNNRKTAQVNKEDDFGFVVLHDSRIDHGIVVVSIQVDKTPDELEGLAFGVLPELPSSLENAYFGCVCFPNYMSFYDVG